MPSFAAKDCYQTKQGNQARCLSYSPNMNVANVGCLSKCESEKVMSFVKARKLDHHYKVNEEQKRINVKKKKIKHPISTCHYSIIGSK